MIHQPSTINPPKALRLLILGGGAIVSECHLPALRVLGWSSACRVVDILDRNLAILRALDSGAAIDKCDFRAALREPGLSSRFDAALVALPHSLHDEACELALAAGLHVLCEKPLALDPASCRRLHDLAARAQRQLLTAMVRRFLPNFRAMDAALQDNLAGAIREIDIEDGAPFRWNADTETVFRRDQGGVLAGMGVHFLDYLLARFGPLAPVSYTDDSRGGPEANAEIVMRTHNGIPVRLKLSWTHDLRNTFEVRGERGCLAADKAGFEFCAWRPAAGGSAGFLKPVPLFESGDWQSTFEACFVEQFHHLAHALRGGPCRLPDAHESAAAMEIVQWAYARRDAAPARIHAAGPSLPPGRVVVTGGTGFVGTRMVERLADLGFRDIVVPVRSFRTAARVACCPVVLCKADLTNPVETRDLLKSARYVFHLAYGADADKDGAFTVEAARNVTCEAIAAGAEAVVVFSTGTVLAGHEGEGPVDETWPDKPALGAYGRAKSLMEQQILDLARSSGGTRVTILQPGAVYGPWGRTFTETPVRLANDESFCWIEGGAGIANYVHVDNLVDAAFLAAMKSEAHGQRFLIVDGACTWREFLGPLLGSKADALPSFTASEIRAIHAGNAMTTWRDVLRALMEDTRLMAAFSRHPVLGRAKRFVAKRLPRFHRSVRALRTQEDRIRKPRLHEAPMPPDWLADLFGAARLRFSSAKARAILGWTPAIALSTGQEQCICWISESVRFPK